MNELMHDGFLLPHDYKPERLCRVLGGEQRCQVTATSDFSLKFYDSFDWRLHAAGLRLLRIAAGDGAELRLKSAAGGPPIQATVHAEEPAWPADLPAGELRDTVAGLLSMRVLLCLATVQCESTELRILNDDGKTVARLQFLRMRCDAEGLSEPRALWPRLRVSGVKGYESEQKELLRLFSEEMEWPIAPDCLFDETITAVGREPGDYSSKLDVALQPDQPAIAALRKILLTLLDTLERNVPGTRADLDSEFLHDLRVATRRTRSALSQVKRVLPDTVVETYKERFAWLGQITGPTRDLDVFLLELPRYRASLPAAMARDLDPLEDLLKTTHKKEQALLKRRLGSAEMGKLLKEWRALLEAETPPGEPGLLADQPVDQVVSQRIWKMYRRVIKAGRAIDVDGPAEAMHELRKDCKKLRYLIEFFRGIYPADEVKSLIKALKELLDNLGEFQDLEVQADKLRAFAGDFPPDDPKSRSTIMAIGALVADLLRHQQAAHGRFAECFARFDSAHNRDGYKALFRQP